jgi:RNA polymerase sigma-70 factor (ECF subfamily)
MTEACAALAVADDHERFEAEALPYIDDVYRFALSLTRDAADADDVVQETFLRAYRSWHTFQPGSDARRWLFTITRNVFLRSRERERRHVGRRRREVLRAERGELQVRAVQQRRRPRLHRREPAPDEEVVDLRADGGERRVRGRRTAVWGVACSVVGNGHWSPICFAWSELMSPSVRWRSRLVCHASSTARTPAIATTRSAVMRATPRW